MSRNSREVVGHDIGRGTIVGTIAAVMATPLDDLILAAKFTLLALLRDGPSSPQLLTSKLYSQHGALRSTVCVDPWTHASRLL